MVLVVQENLEQQSERVQEMLGSAFTGAAKVVARKLLDTLKREAVAFEDEQRAQYLAPAPSPSAALEGLPSNITSNTTAFQLAPTLEEHF